MYRIETSKDGQNWRKSERLFNSPEGAKLHAESWISMGIHYMTRVVSPHGKIIAEYRAELDTDSDDTTAQFWAELDGQAA